MGKFVVGQAVGADHGVLEGQHPAQIFFVHLVVDCPGGLQTFDGLIDARTPFATNVSEVTTGALGVWRRPGDQHALGGCHRFRD